MLRDYFFYAAKNLLKRKLRTWLTMIGIFIGIAAVVSLIALGQGMRNAILGQFETLGTDKLTVEASGTGFGPPGSTVIKPLTLDDRDAIEQVPGVELVVNRMIRSVSFEFHDIRNFEGITNLPEEDKERALVLDVLNVKLAEGKMIDGTDQSKVVLGNGFAKDTRYGKAVHAGNKVLIGGTTFEVAGILKRSGNPFFNDIILMNEDAFREVLNIDDDIDLLVVQVKEGADVPQVQANIEKVMRRQRDVEKGKEDFTVQSPLQTLATLDTILTTVQTILVGIAAISLIVGGIGIMNTMYTSVLERTREIGIMKAIGAKNSDVLLIFLTESGLLGMAGGLVGIALGIGLAKLVEVAGAAALGEGVLVAQFSMILIIGALLFSFIVGTVSGVLPSYQASQLEPVDALRK